MGCSLRLKREKKKFEVNLIRERLFKMEICFEIGMQLEEKRVAISACLFLMCLFISVIRC